MTVSRSFDIGPPGRGSLHGFVRQKWCISRPQPEFFFMCVLELVEAAETVDSAVEEREMAECQSLGAEGGAAAAPQDHRSAASSSSDTPREPTSTSTPDTDSPVMINEDVSQQ